MIMLPPEILSNSPYWDFQTETVKPGAPPDVKAALEKAYQEDIDYHKRYYESDTAVFLAARDAAPDVLAAMKKAWEDNLYKGPLEANLAALQAAAAKKASPLANNNPG